MIKTLSRYSMVCGFFGLGLAASACGDDTGGGGGAGSGGAGSGGAAATSTTDATTATATTGGEGGSSSIVSPECQEGFDKLEELAAALPCEGSTSAAVFGANCDQLILADVCVTEMGAFVDCLVAAETSDFECDGGEVRPAGTTCDAENEALSACG